GAGESRLDGGAGNELGGQRRSSQRRFCASDQSASLQCTPVASISARVTAPSGPLAQRSELSAHNRLVPGSNPGGPKGVSPAMPWTSAPLNQRLRAFESSAGARP